ncbi:histone-lysine N-methyltransferase set-1-like [Megalobrama amblycephala]|uniref:histone-lysine N-methyltransferase set-1-like n=1 Tax=Megalobrama amblycephala TaxID=75352 RepID=UPI0020140EE1|nr:histone-lysine N-methyltransferase set-1-like [Megalobrama amblycephala]
MCFPGKCSHMALLDAKKTTTPINGRWREIMLKSKRRKTPLQDAEDHMTHRTDKPGLQEQFISKYKGRGVFTTRAFFRGDFVLEYRGELLSSEESLDRTEHYTEAENAFLFDFQWSGRNWCMDASKEDCSLGRLVNDEHRNPTCKMRTLEVSRNLTCVSLLCETFYQEKKSPTITETQTGHGESRRKGVIDKVTVGQLE